MSDADQTEEPPRSGEPKLVNPSAMLEGLALQGGWTVLSRIDLSAETTGTLFLRCLPSREFKGRTGILKGVGS
jgi:hypothetical protein